MRTLSRGVACRQGAVEICEDFDQVAAILAPLELRLIDLDDQADRVQHPDRDRLRAAHAAQTGSEDEATYERSAEVLPGDRAQDLIAALQHSLRPDVLPVARGEAAPHREAGVGERVEVLRGRVVTDDVAVRHHDDRGKRLGGEHADRLARLDDERLAVAHRLQRGHDPVEGIPIPGRLRQRRVDDEVLRTLADLEHVLEHPQQAFLPPAEAAQRRAAFRDDLARAAHGRATT